ncbi:RNA exonuclease ngl2 [Mycoemilia scoparia]|uniref:RNA exonuclease ngl2 n=1 Tax=Mycoemilia scoparia TaxID=417184 RepID=A0A9W8A1J6_9FUNG|nr:RNA exonuclease ngl2 [Mycoemilia scoparia]
MPAPKSCINRGWVDIPIPAKKDANIPSVFDNDSNSSHNEDTPKPFTIMTYNILAQPLVKRSLFPYASKTSLRWKSRKQLFMNEFSYLKPDIACLQEVGTTNYHQDYNTFFKSQGYENQFFQSRAKSHGLCMLWKKNKLELLKKVHLKLNPSVTLFDEKLHTDNVAQIYVLAFKDSLPRPNPDPYADCVSPEHQAYPSSPAPHNSNDESADQRGEDEEPMQRGVIVSNTHLFWLPSASYERLGQQIVITKAINDIQEQYPDFPVIMCGDFNTTPDDALYSLLTSSQRPVDLNEWQCDQLLPCQYSDDENEDGQEANNDTKETTTTTANSSNTIEDTDKTKTDGSKGKSDEGNGKDLTVPPTPPCATTTKTKVQITPEKEQTMRMLEKTEEELEAILIQDTEKVNKLVLHIQDILERPFTSAYSIYTDIDPGYKAEDWDGEPKYTNYTNWKGTLDYIFIQNHHHNGSYNGSESKLNGRGRLKVRQIMSLPSQDEMEPGLPNDTFPSDHVALMARLVYEA